MVHLVAYGDGRNEMEVENFEEITRYLILSNGAVRYLKETLSDVVFQDVVRAATSAYIQGYQSGKVSKERSDFGNRPTA